jgi:hypothetical protein
MKSICNIVAAATILSGATLSALADEYHYRHHHHHYADMSKHTCLLYCLLRSSGYYHHHYVDVPKYRHRPHYVQTHRYHRHHAHRWHDDD